MKSREGHTLAESSESQIAKCLFSVYFYCCCVGFWVGFFSSSPLTYTVYGNLPWHTTSSDLESVTQPFYTILTTEFTRLENHS